MLSLDFLSPKITQLLTVSSPDDCPIAQVRRLHPAKVGHLAR